MGEYGRIKHMDRLPGLSILPGYLQNLSKIFTVELGVSVAVACGMFGNGRTRQPFKATKFGE